MGLVNVPGKYLSSNDFLLRLWILEQPCLVLCRITNEDALLSVGLQLLSLVFLDIHKRSAAKNAKMRDIWLRLVPELKWSSRVTISRCGRAIVYMNKCSQCIPPETARKLGLIKEGDDSFHEYTIGSLSHSILMRFSTHSVLSLNVMLNTKLFPLSRYVLPTLIIVQDLLSAVMQQLPKQEQESH